MAEPQKINRIDLLVHPFFGFHGNDYDEKRIPTVIKMWKKHIDEIATQKDRLLFMESGGRTSRRKDYEPELITYAKEKLGKRFASIRLSSRPISIRVGIEDQKKTHHYTVHDFAKANGFSIDSAKIKTRGLGEYTNACVTYSLTMLNVHLGLKDPIPYRNRQSTMLPRRSISSRGEYPFPWQREAIMKFSPRERKRAVARFISEFRILRRDSIKNKIDQAKRWEIGEGRIRFDFEAYKASKLKKRQLTRRKRK